MPITLILFGVGVMGFLFARNALLDEWKKVSILKLQRAAHQIDMRLNQSVQLIKMFHKTGDLVDGYAFQKWIVEQLKDLQGVRDVVLELVAQPGQIAGMDAIKQSMGRGKMTARGRSEGARPMMRFHRAKIVEVTPPRHDVKAGGKTVSLISSFKDADDKIVGSLEVSLDFEHLLKDIKVHGWWQSDMAGLVDDVGRFLFHTKAEDATDNLQLGKENDPLELALLTAIKEKPYGTILGPGHPPERVGGYYKIENAPWTLVLLAPGKSVLAPIIRFLFYYVIAGLLSIGIILFLIRFVGGKMVGSIREIAEAADQVAQGKYGRPLAIKTKDEIGRLRYQFNTMVSGLKERDFIRNTFGRYVDHEIAEKLLKRPEASRLGGEKRKVAILMSDIRNFTTITESLDPESVIRMLNHYFSYIIELFRKYRGIIVDFYGDGVLVFFDPLDEPPEPELRAALRCALEVQDAMEQLNAELASNGLPRLSVGIGINVGEVVVGNIGSETRAKYGIVGTAVNMTQRIQSKAKGGEVVISQSVHEHIGKELMTQKPFQTTLKGIQHEINLYVVDQLLDVS